MESDEQEFMAVVGTDKDWKQRALRNGLVEAWIKEGEWARIGKCGSDAACAQARQQYGIEVGRRYRQWMESALVSWIEQGLIKDWDSLNEHIQSMVEGIKFTAENNPIELGDNDSSL